MDNKLGYVYNTDNDDIWTSDVYEDIDDCISDAIDDSLDLDKPTFRLGAAYDLGCPSIDIQSVIERLQEQAYDMYGECADGYLYDINESLEQELEDKLQNALEEFCNEKGIDLSPNAHSIDDIEEIKFCAYCKQVINEDEEYQHSFIEDGDTVEEHYYHKECDYIPITHLVPDHRYAEYEVMEEIIIEEY